MYFILVLVLSLASLCNFACAKVDGVVVYQTADSIDYGLLKAANVKYIYIETHYKTTGAVGQHFNITAECKKATNAGILCGATRFKNFKLDAATVAEDFAKGDGKWPGPEGATRLPGALQILDDTGCDSRDEVGSYVEWIETFLDTYEKFTGRKAVIYTANGYWEVCAGNSGEFDEYPLMTFDQLPIEFGSWETHTFTHISDRKVGKTKCDNGRSGHYENGDLEALKKFAKMK